MNVERVPFAEQSDMAWANGQGRTRQVAIEPRDGSLARGFHWRISRAQVAAAGPFSRLPGIDRSLWLLAGDGLRLQVEGRAIELVRPLQRFDFAGELDVHAELCGGPVADLNVMTARAWGRAQAEVVELADGAVLPLPDAPQRVVVVLRGQCEVDGVVAADGDALRVHASAVRAGRAHSAALVLVVGFTPSA